MTEFKVDPVILSGSHRLCDWPLCRLFLQNDAHYHWGVLVPRRMGIVEVCELDEPDQIQLMAEVVLLSKIIRKFTDVEKLNIGSLGNIVAQLHVHVIGRSRKDPAWPGPVWGQSKAKPWPNPQEAPLARALTER